MVLEKVEMNTKEKIIVFLLVLGLIASFWYGRGQKPSVSGRERVPASAAKPSSASVDANRAASTSTPASCQSSTASAIEAPRAPERKVVLENDLLKLELSSCGAVVKRATLKDYARNIGAVSEENPAIEFDFSSSPLGTIEGIPGLAADADYEVESSASNAVVFVNGKLKRTYRLEGGYRLALKEDFAADVSAPNHLSIGAIAMGASKNDVLSIDSWQIDSKGGKAIHHGEGDSPFKPFLATGAGGCSGAPNAAGMPAVAKAFCPGAQKYVALKNRFFVTALANSTASNSGFEASIARDANSQLYRPESVSAKVAFTDSSSRESLFYIGPKKQSLLWDLGMKDVMEFGMWRVICYPLVWILNLFNSWIPNYGVAIILLTVFVRLLFWPLTHKSTVGMKKMQELQPKMKAIQEKFKDNPQRMQQETFALYREAKVNPLSSCLPMLIQIPVFIALFNVLRSAVELRYAGFLWIADLSEPEALFAGVFPFGGLNILPILMAVTTALQSYFTPSAGDRSQQRMMMVMMPLMMLFMFYSFPSALSLYWFMSNLFSIAQMWLIRRQTAAKQSASGAIVSPDDVIDPPVTRQMRRHHS